MLHRSAEWEIIALDMESLPHTPRIGVLGGTFNPLHMGHLIMAQDALELFELSKVVFVPCASPPHKSAREVVSAAHRLAMIEAALEGDTRFEVSDIEIQRGGVSYSVDTAGELKKLYPDAEICFIVGSDTLQELHLWKDIDRLCSMCVFLTIARPGSIAANGVRGPARDGAVQGTPQGLRNHVKEGHLVNISSTDIRYRVAEGMSIRYLVHPAVEMYIAEHSLFRR